MLLAALLSIVLAPEPGQVGRIVRDYPYLQPPRNVRVDVYNPLPPADGGRSPVVVWFHGGGFYKGSKGDPREVEVCRTLAQNGYVAISVDYRLGDGSWPQNVLDAKNAVRFVRANADKLDADTSRIAVAGASAGGNLALMVGYTTGMERFEPTAPYPGVSSAVRCVIDLYGPTDYEVAHRSDQPMLQKALPQLAKAFGAASTDGEAFRAASPIHYVSRSSPPTLVMQGLADDTVDVGQSETLVKALKQNGVPCDAVYLPGVGHTFDWETWNGRALPRDLRPIALAFLGKYLGPVRR